MSIERSAGQGYSSPIDLGLGKMPETDDPGRFQEYVPIYNAIHLLNAYFDNLRSGFDIGKKGAPLDEQMPFRVGYWAEAAEDVKQGEVVSLNEAGKVRLGIRMRMKRSATLGFGLVIKGGKAGDQVQVGVPPAIVKVPGLKQNEGLWAFNFAQSNKGKLARGGLPKWDGAMIGVGICNDFAMMTAIRPYWPD